MVDGLHPISAAVLVLAGISLYLAGYHLWIHLQRRTHARDLHFAAMCGSILVYDLCSVGLYEAQNLAEGVFWQRLQICSLAVLGIFFVRFAESFVEHQPRPWVRRAAWAFPVVALIGLVERWGWLLSDEPAIKTLEFRFAPPLTYYEVETGPLLILLGSSVVALLVYVWRLARDADRRGWARGRALWLATGLFLGGILYDTAITSGLIRSIYLIEFAWAAMLILMGAVLSREVVDSANAKRALRVTELRLSRTLASIAEGVITLGARGELRHVNRAATRILGVGREHLDRHGLLEILGFAGDAEADGEGDADAYADAEARLGAADGQTVLLHRDAGECRLQVAVAPLLGEDGATEGQVVVIRDITREHAEAERSARASRLESIGRLAGGLAHDLNNLLSPIVTNSELLSLGLTEPEETSELAGQVLDAALRAAGLTKQLLVVGRRSSLEPVPLSVESSIEEMLPLLRRVVGEKVDVELSAADGLPRVLADPSQLEQVWLNLAVNARDAMPEGGRLSFHVARVDAQLRVTARDTGEGMDAAVRAHLFEPFFTTKGDGEGTGLGLATVHGIVAQHGGRIEVDSRPGEGATFSLYFPLREDDLPHPKAARSQAA